MKNNYCSKIILIGEYALIQGAKAIAIPNYDFNGALRVGRHDDEIEKFVKYLLQSSLLGEYLDFPRLESDLTEGVYFDSNIPQGSGLGSSGALCASIFGEYGKRKDLKLDHVRDILALMESFYHGTSSGIDPLVSYIEKPLLVQNRNQVQEIELVSSSELGEFALIDTHIQRKTAPLVHQYIRNCDEGTISKSKVDKFIENTNQGVTSLLEGNKEEFFKNLIEISRFQYTQLNDFIPKEYRDIWLEGIEKKQFVLKFCGAGGGGHLLAFTPHKDYLKNLDLDLMFFKW